MMRDLKYCLLTACLLASVAVMADEGMWMLGNLDKKTTHMLKEMGLELKPKELYSPRKASLKDAVVSFGGFCSGVVVSEDGLVLTNHHCGFSSVQQHSSVDHDYLQDGFVARTRDEELPNPELYVRFLLRQENVTKRVLSAVRPDMDESARASAVDSVMLAVGAEVSQKDSTLTGVVDAYYGGNEFWLSVYQDFNDVRLVFAPPSSVGKFGWDKDNWMWPRHTGDFCVFRIYAGRGNRPADYSPDNVPYHPRYVAPISLEGYQEGDFCIYKEDGTVLFADDDMRSDSQYEMYDRGAAYINDQNDLILVSAITGESKVCDTNVAYLVGEGYSKFGATSGYLLLAYGVNEDGKIVAVNINMIP